MPMLEPFSPIALSADILANIATDILKHHAQALEGTRAGRLLKRAGIIEPDFDDRLRDTLAEALGLYFQTYRRYSLAGIEAFFRDPAIAQQIGGYILDRKPISEDEIQQALDRHLGTRKEGVTRVLIEQRGLEPERIVPDFLECYRRVLSKRLSVPQMAILLEVLELKHLLAEQLRPEIPSPPEPTGPPEVAEFVGREAELAYFAEKLATSHLAVISGMAGVGKTALAAVLVRRVGDPEKTFWHSFRGDEGVGNAIRRLAGFLFWRGQEDLWRMLESSRLTSGQPPPTQELLDYLVQAVRGRGYLVCLDDFQCLSDDDAWRLGEFVQRLLAEEASFVITSRRVPPFVQMAEFEPLAGLSVDDTYSLLAQRGLLLADDLAADLYAHTGGNAQFLTLAVDALLRTEDRKALIAHLSETDDIERYLMTEVDQNLTEDERAVMIGVAALLGYSGTRDAIEAILEHDGLQRVLNDLSYRHLLTVSTGETGREYGQHATVQAFYYHLLGRREWQALHRRAGAYYESEEPDALKAARHFVCAGAYERAARLATANVWPLINRGEVRALQGLLEQLAVQELYTVLRAEVNIARGQVYAVLGEGQAARRGYEEALSQLTALSDSPGVCELRARACRGMGELLQYESAEKALSWLRRGLDELAGVSVLEEAALQIRVGSVLIPVGDCAAAKEAIEQGLGRLPEGPSQLRAIALINLGVIYSYQGDVKRGNEYTRRALSICKQLHDYFRMVDILSNLSCDEFIAGDWERAIADSREAMVLAEDLGSDVLLARVQTNLAVMLSKRGDDEKGDSEAAMKYLSNSIELARKHALGEHLIWAEVGLADYHIRQGESEAAQPLLADVEQLALEKDYRYQLPEIYRLWAQVHLAKGELPAALDCAERSVNLARELELAPEEGTSLRVLGQALHTNGQQEQAVAAFEKSLSMLADGDLYEAACTKVEWGRRLKSSGDAEQGAALLQEARSMFQKLGARRDLADMEDAVLGD